MKKKIFCLSVALILIFANLPISNIEAEELGISAVSAVLIDGESGKLLYERNKDELRPIASITKVMTLLLVMEAIERNDLNLDEVLTASAHASSMGGSDIWLKEGEQMSVDDLLKATVIMSANDAAVVLAERIGGSEEGFVEMMNARAKELGMTNTVFKNCNGLDAEGHLSTAYDVALMSNALIKHEKITDYTLTWIDSVRDGATQLVNTNRLIKNYVGITGLKTGTTSTAGSCIAATATRDSMTMIAVVLGATSTDNRFQDATTLLNHGFAKWTYTSPSVSIPSEVEIGNGMSEYIKIKADGNCEVLAENMQVANIKAEIVLVKDLQAPVYTNQEIGKIFVKNGDKILKEVPLIATEDIEEITFSKVFKLFFSKFSLG